MATAVTTGVRQWVDAAVTGQECLGDGQDILAPAFPQAGEAPVHR
jgi:hypothetical protein